MNLCTPECILDLLHSWKKASFPLWMSRGSMKKKIERECVFRGEFFFLYIYIYSANREFFTMNGEKLNFVYNFFGTRFGFFSSSGSIDT